MSSRSEQYLARAEKCQQYADTARIPGTKRLYEVLASQWQHLANQADRPDETGKACVFENKPPPVDSERGHPVTFRGADALSRHLPVEVLVRKRRRPIARSFSVAARAA